MEPAQAPLSSATILTEIDETGPNWFTVVGFGSRFYCHHWFVEGDKIKVSIRKVPSECPPSSTTQPAPSSNS